MPNVNRVSIGYRRSSGEILHTVTSAGQRRATSHIAYLDDVEIDDINAYRVDVETRQLVPKLRFAAGTWFGDEYTVPLPSNTTALWQGRVYLVRDGELTVIVDQAGQHPLKLLHALYFDEVQTLENPHYA